MAASANNMNLLKASIILALGQKNADNSLALFPACLLNSLLISYAGLNFTLGVFNMDFLVKLNLAAKQVPKVLKQEIETV